MSKAGIFTVGGTVQAGGGRYIPRRVDEELLALCRSGTFAFVLSARQMGKSSLMVRTAQRLSEEGTRSAIVDLTQIGVQIDSDAWYFGLVTAISDSLDLETDVFSWWQAHGHLGLAHRLTGFFRDVLLPEIDESVVVFIDEIDSTLSLPFTDDFFAVIRYVYNARADVPAFKRLSFVLLGVATPLDLISDARRTPFNVGREVDVEYFTLEEAMPLSEGFDMPSGEAHETLRQVVQWTGGHPYLTQRLCYVIAQQRTRISVDRAVAETFLGDRSEQEGNLRFVHDMLTRRAQDPVAVLRTYKQILAGRPIADDRQSPVVTHLKLSGVVGRRNGRLEVQNAIYAAVFNRSWIKEQWPESWYKRIPPVVAGLVAVVFLAIILLGLFLLQTQRALQAQERSTLQEALNAQLSDQILVADSLRNSAETANLLLSEQIELVDSLREVEVSVNALLSDQIRVAESLNVRISREVLLADSLRAVEEKSNEMLLRQVQITDSLRSVAETRLDEVNAASLETRTLALATKALRQLKLGDAHVAALLARQAFHFSRRSEDEFLATVYDALLQSLNTVSEELGTPGGGPIVLPGHTAGVRSVAYDPTGRWIASAAEDGTVAVWSAETHAHRQLAGHRGGVRALDISPDGRLIASGADDRTVRLWSVRAEGDAGETVLGRHEGSVWTIAFSPDGKRLASAGADRKIVVWDRLQSEWRRTVELSSGARIRAIAFSPDGGALASASEDGVVRIWTLRDSSAPLFWDAGQGRLLSLAFSPDGSLLATGGDSREVKLWRLLSSTANVVRSLKGHEGPINAVAFSPDGKSLASASSDRSVHIWRLDHLEQDPIVLQDHSSWVWTIGFSPDGKELVTGSADMTLRVWNTSPERLASRICETLEGRELTREEWDRHVGPDYSYALEYVPCGSVTNASGSR